MKSDLTDADIDALDALLRQAPEPLQPLDVMSLDGYLCAVVLQPRIVPSEEWLPPALDTDGNRWPPADLDAAWLNGVQALMQRRYEAIVRGLAEEEGFDPIVGDTSEPPAEDDPYKDTPAHSRALLHWASGFLYGADHFQALLEHPEDAVHLSMARILRHLPPESDDDREAIATLDREHPLADESAAVDDVIEAALTLWTLTQKERFAVRTVQRSCTKVGRNDPCPCGSGRKFKQCHGAAGAPPLPPA